MAYPPGGKSDKYGNYYEFQFVLKAFLDVIENSITSFKYEPFGDEEQGVDK